MLNPNHKVSHLEIASFINTKFTVKLFCNILQSEYTWLSISSRLTDWIEGLDSERWWDIPKFGSEGVIFVVDGV